MKAHRLLLALTALNLLLLLFSLGQTRAVVAEGAERVAPVLRGPCARDRG